MYNFYCFLRFLVFRMKLYIFHIPRHEIGPHNLFRIHVYQA